jgi:hypothetical protein
VAFAAVYDAPVIGGRRAHGREEDPAAVTVTVFGAVVHALLQLAIGKCCFQGRSGMSCCFQKGGGGQCCFQRGGGGGGQGWLWGGGGVHAAVIVLGTAVPAKASSVTTEFQHRA